MIDWFEQAQYGMDNDGSFRQQSEAGMMKASRLISNG